MKRKTHLVSLVYKVPEQVSDSVPAATTNQMPAKLPPHLSTTYSAKLKRTAHPPEEVKLMEIDQSDEENVINSDEMEKKILELYTKHYSLQGTKHQQPQQAKLPGLPPPQTSTTDNMAPETADTIAEEKYTYREYLDSNENFNPF